MIAGIEIALLFVGVYALVTGKLPTNKKAKHVVHGWPARAIGIVALLPLPISFAIGFFVAALLAAQGKQVTRESFFWLGTGIELAVLVACGVAIGIMSHVYRTPVEQPLPASDVQPPTH